MCPLLAPSIGRDIGTPRARVKSGGFQTDALRNFCGCYKLSNRNLDGMSPLPATIETEATYIALSGRQSLALTDGHGPQMLSWLSSKDLPAWAQAGAAVIALFISVWAVLRTNSAERRSGKTSGAEHCRRDLSRNL